METGTVLPRAPMAGGAEMNAVASPCASEIIKVFSLTAVISYGADRRCAHMGLMAGQNPADHLYFANQSAAGT
ncbi:hypothetical protein [Streptomyces sp. NPDC088180]|uniref:hypothetical protein n=1 Tax=Streptomyces sp. NPDC088180 TaxID=3365837 RepID=UPI0037F3DA67